VLLKTVPGIWLTLQDDAGYDTQAMSE